MRIFSLLLVTALIGAWIGCGPTTPTDNSGDNGNTTTNDNSSSGGGSVTLDLTQFSLFQFCAPAVTCPGAQADDLFTAFIVDLRDVGFDFSLNATVLSQGNPLADQCVGADDPCLIEENLEQTTLTEADLANLVAVFGTVDMFVQEGLSCPSDTCDAVFCWAFSANSEDQFCISVREELATALLGALNELRPDR
jgi:hypothetical protein